MRYPECPVLSLSACKRRSHPCVLRVVRGAPSQTVLPHPTFCVAYVCIRRCPFGQAGWYPVSRSEFVRCQPPVACVGELQARRPPFLVSSRAPPTPEYRSFALVSPPSLFHPGGVNSTAVAASSTVACARNYRGTRCGDCNIGSYRLRGKCRTCPNTAWLLLLSFFLAITAFVAVGVWMSKKNINLAGLAIGVVCGGACATDVPEHYVSCGALSAGAAP